MSYNKTTTAAKGKEEQKREDVVTKEDLNPDKLNMIPFEILANKDGPTKKQDYLFKMIIIGNSGVGKSCLMHRVTTNSVKFLWSKEVFYSMSRVSYRPRGWKSTDKLKLSLLKRLRSIQPMFGRIQMALTLQPPWVIIERG